MAFSSRSNIVRKTGASFRSFVEDCVMLEQLQWSFFALDFILAAFKRLQYIRSWKHKI